MKKGKKNRRKRRKKTTTPALERIAYAAPSTSEAHPNRFNQVNVPKGQRVLWITDTRDGATFVVGYEFKDLRPGEVDPLNTQHDRLEDKAHE